MHYEHGLLKEKVQFILFSLCNMKLLTQPWFFAIFLYNFYFRGQFQCKLIIEQIFIALWLSSPPYHPESFVHKLLCSHSYPHLSGPMSLLAPPIASLMLWHEEMIVSRDANPVITFPGKKRINTELFIYRMAALYMLNVWMKNIVRGWWFS